MTSVLFWLAIPLGFFGFPVGVLSFVLIPFAVISLFNEFAAPRGVLFVLLAIQLCTSLPLVAILGQRIWQLLDPSEDNPKHALALGSQVLSSAASVAYLTSHGWIGTPNSTSLLTAYWFYSITTLWGSFFLILTAHFWTSRRDN